MLKEILTNKKKVLAAIFIIIAVSAGIGLAFGKVTPIEFWLATGCCAVFAWLILPGMK